MSKSHQPPHHGEEQPAAQEGHSKDDQRVTPLQVHQGGENVLQESPLLTDVFVCQVASPVLGDEAGFAWPVSDARLAQVLGSNPCQHILFRDDTLPSQHLPVTIVHSARRKMGGGPSTTSLQSSLYPAKRENLIKSVTDAPQQEAPIRYSHQQQLH